MTYTGESIQKMQKYSIAGHQSAAKILKDLKRSKLRLMDDIVHKLHDEEFERIDCMECGNCCKSISPAIYALDISRMATASKMKESDFAEKYLLKDGDGSYVFKNTPCPFIGADNYCHIYNARSKACRQYPHTNRKRFYQIIDLSLKNYSVCPAVFNIIEKLKTNKN